MNTWKQSLLTNWHLMRLVRLGLGLMMLVMGIQSKEWAIGLFSVFFLYQVVTDTGCCGTGGCNMPQDREIIGKLQEANSVVNEDIK